MGETRDLSAVSWQPLGLCGQRERTPLFYKQTDELHFSKQAIGNLGVFSGGFAMLATILYGYLIKRVHVRFLHSSG